MPQPRTSWLIGSAAECDIQVGSPYVSGRHCRLTLDNGTWILEDLGSTNGTYVNGSRLAGATAVTPADRVTLGSSTALPWPPGPADGPAAATIPLPEPHRPVVIGRSPACDVVLSLPMVSSRHAILEPVDEGWQIRDLGSTNGTFVEGRRIDGPTPVGTGDVIGLGSFRLKLTGDGSNLVERSTGQSVLEAREVGVAVEGHRLIRDISLVVCPGELVAIMGPSGAGKSTLLATLVGGRQPDEGYVLLGGEDLYARFDEFRGQIGYVPQDDIMHRELTVSQAVWFGARLRLPRDYSDAEIERRVATVIDELGLTGCEHVRIGSADRRGISGGQRKRVNVALELITDPPMLVLDEPTSGLSSTDALALLKLLRGLTQGGKTIVLTIHQPGAEAMRQLDGLAVIARDASTRDVGHLAWYGPAVPDSVRFFESRGRPDDAEAVLRGLATRPVADILHTAERLQPTRLTDRLPVRGTDDELDRMSQTINRLLDEVAALVERQEQFVADAAHELRGPLAAVQGALEVAITREHTAQEYRETLDDILASTRHLSKVANDLLLLAERGGQQRLAAGPGGDAAAVARQATAMFAGVAEERELALTCSAPGTIPVTMDTEDLRRVLANLLDNAVRFTPAGGRIEVRVTADPAPTIVVADTGCGIEEADLARVFDRFYKADRSRTHAGTIRSGGLGLAICKSLVDGAGGRIGVESSRGRGTVVSVTLPPRTRSG